MTEIECGKDTLLTLFSPSMGSIFLISDKQVSEEEQINDQIIVHSNTNK